MIQSMTGYGRAEGRHKGMPILVEVRSVNHRHCEVMMRIPRALQPYEEKLKNRVLTHVGRGRLDVSVSLSGNGETASTALRLDRRLAHQYLALLRELQRELGVSGAPDLALLAGYRDIIRPMEQLADDQGTLATSERILDKALRALVSMRRHEGRALERDLLSRLAELERRIDVIHARLPEITQEQFVRLQARLNRLLEATPGARERIDGSRLAQEVALLADRSDVSEEVTRLESHLQQFRNFLRKSEPVGRSLDFLLQEMNREVTTIGSKVGDLSVTQEIISAKAELEKIREQVQNVE